MSIEERETTIPDKKPMRTALSPSPDRILALLFRFTKNPIAKNENFYVFFLAFNSN
jgi:hypothetical protein